MKVINQLKSLKEELSFQNNQSIGYVPTMGALHQGHLSLVKLAKKKSQFIIKNDFTKRTALKYVRYILKRVLKWKK